MKTILSAAVAIAALSSCTNAVFTMNIRRNAETNSLKKRGLELRSTITEPLDNNATGGDYIAKVSVGTPPQDVTLAIDTGSSDTWMMAADADLCTSAALQAQLKKGGCASTYDPSKSSTYKIAVKGKFDISYADSSGAKGDYMTDNLSIGGATITALEMGLAHKATLTTGLLGIGYDVNEASNSLTTGRFVYPSIIDTMVDQSLINIRAYSLYLDDLDSSTGSIIFGGLDSDKFQGNLIQVPVVPDHYKNGTEVFAELKVNMTSFGITSQTGNTANTAAFTQFPIVLDSGTSLTYLPDALATRIFAMIGAYDDSSTSGQVFVDCNILKKTPGQTFNFGFQNGAVIKIDMTEMVFPLTGLFYTPAKYIPSSQTLGFSSACALGIQPGGSSGPFLMGDTFLRSAYVVYDLKNNLIGLAQTNFDSNKTTIVEFEATATALPTVSGVAVSTTILKSKASVLSTSMGAALLSVGAAFVMLA